MRAAAAGPVPRAAAAGPLPRADAPPHTTHALLLPPDRAGFRHSAFTFGCEAMVAKSNISGAKIPPGQLVNFIQKGIMYAELERSIAADGTDHPSTEPFSLLQSPAAEKRGGKGASGGASSSEPVAMDTDGGGGELTPEEQVTTLAGHDGEVFICAWSPTSLQLASGSGDSTARIWAVPSGACGKAQTKAMAAPSVLQHVGADKEKVKDVTTLDWSPDGASLATGAYDGQARIWSGAAGKLLRTLTKHKGPIFSLKWNKKGDYLLSGSVDKTAIVWDAKTGDAKQQFDFHTAPTLDVDWRNNVSFATSSMDHMIYVCKLGESKPIKAFKGHTDEVNAIKWDPTGTLLASCSDDYSAKIWSLKQDECVHELKEHTKEDLHHQVVPDRPGDEQPGHAADTRVGVLRPLALRLLGGQGRRRRRGGRLRAVRRRRRGRRLAPTAADARRGGARRPPPAHGRLLGREADGREPRAHAAQPQRQRRRHVPSQVTPRGPVSLSTVAPPQATQRPNAPRVRRAQLPSPTQPV